VQSNGCQVGVAHGATAARTLTRSLRQPLTERLRGAAARHDRRCAHLLHQRLGNGRALVDPAGKLGQIILQARQPAPVAHLGGVGLESVGR
jgi:hypothetical protein